MSRKMAVKHGFPAIGGNNAKMGPGWWRGRAEKKPR
jgi:hypothetical protein